MKRLLLLLSLIWIPIIGFSQVGINTTNPNAQLDIKSSNQTAPANTDGILIPKIDAFPVTNPTAPQQGMMVYLTSLSSGKPPGFYYWDNSTTSWIGLSGSKGWDIIGNSGTTAGTNFIGTTDDNDVVFKRNNVISGKIATYSTSFGNEALFLNTTGDHNTAIGSQALYNNTDGHHNMALGNSALSSNTNGAHNIALGFSALAQNNNGLYNVAMGSIALSKNIGGISNTAIGAEALREVTGSNNTALGFDAGVNTTTGNNNIAIGANTNVPNIAGNDQMSIGNVIYGADMSTTALGKIGIGVPVPTEKLEVAGKTKTTNLQVTTGAGVGKILTSDAVGNATWQNNPATATSWDLLGNAGTNPTTNFMGTTDDVDVVFRRFNVRAGYLGNINTSFGNYTLNPLSSGNFNTAFGSYTLQANTTGSGNSANGHFALNMNTTGSKNVANGQVALEYNTTGNDNIGIGYSSLFANETGNNNIAIGTNAMTSNKTGSDGTAIGYGAMQYTNSTATAFINKSVAVGFEALRGSTTATNNTGISNTAVGYQSLLANTTGTLNTAVGTESLLANTTGDLNTALGYKTLTSNTTGGSNTAVGFKALTGNTSGMVNTAFGASSLLSNQIGSFNVAIGDGTLQQNRAGIGATAIGTSAMFYANSTTTAFVNNNVAVGGSALKGSTVSANNTGNNNTAVGTESLTVNTTGNSNTANGYQALTVNTTGSNNTALGYLSGNANTTGSNNITIGANANVPNIVGNNQMSIGNVIYGADMSTTALGKIGIGVPIPTEKLEVAGKTKTTNFQMTTGAALNSVLVSDASGNGTWVSPSTIASGTLDQAYDFGGAGVGRTIIADTGAVTINGTDGLVSNGTFGSGVVVPTGTGTRMVWNPRKAAFRSGYVSGNQWDDASTGTYSTAYGYDSVASGNYSTAFGYHSTANGNSSTAFGSYSTASGNFSTAFGASTASGGVSTAFGNGTTASGFSSTAFGRENTAASYGETVLGIGATTYTPSTNGATEFTPANDTDRLLAVGNAIDTNGSTFIEVGERRNALVILKNGNTAIGNTTPSLARLQVQGAVGNTVATFSGSANSQGVSVVSDWPGVYFNSYYSGGVRSMSGTGFTSIVNTDQSTGGLIFQTTNVVNPAAGSLVGTIPIRMTIMGNGNVGIGTPTPNGLFELGLDQGRKPGTSTWTITSDERLKTIHGNYSKGLEEILKLQPITYTYANSGKRIFEEKLLQKEFSGFSAQAVQKIFPEAIGVDDDGFLNFNMHPILVASVNAFKELDIKNKELQIQLEQIKIQQEEINSLKATNADILKRLEKLEAK